jgi:hypothetical protein
MKYLKVLLSRAGTGWKMVNRPVRITCPTGEIPAKTVSKPTKKTASNMK